MTQLLQAERVTLADLETHFALNLAEDAAFFSEWQDSLLPVSPTEQGYLDQVKASYLNLAKRPVLEEMVKMVVLSPLLQLAGFYLPPFYTTSEQSVEVTEEDKGVMIRGKIDVLVIQDQLWILVIESKQSGLSLEVGIPQALAYMLANPQPDKPLFGFVTNGSNFIFLKLVQQPQPLYALSDEFTLRRSGDLNWVLAILKRLKQALI
jgi:hypothetical protein